MAWLQRAKDWAKRIKLDVGALWCAARDRRTPLAAKAVAAAVVAYALSPIDLIPDFIPVLGLLDDLVIVPLGILLAARLIPSPLLEEFRERAKAMGKQPPSRAGLAIVVAIWLLSAVLAGWWILRTAV